MALPNLRIKNGVLLASHFPLTEFEQATRLTADIAAASGTLTVRNISGLAINQVLLKGVFSDETAEILKTHASTAPTGSTVTLAANTVFAATIDTPITVLPYDQVEFSRATTLTGTKTVLATSNISANKTGTGYNDLTNSTGYAFIRFKNSITSVFSSYSTAVPYAGNPVNSVEEIVMKAVGDSQNTLNDDYCKEADLIRDCQEAQSTICNIRDWSFELYRDLTSLVTVIGENEYDLSGLASEMKYPNEGQSMLSVRFGNMPLNKVSYSQIEDGLAYSDSDSLSADATVAATTVTLANSNGFSESGNIYLRSNGFVAYTANDQTTGILSGISATAITTLVPSGATVWQDVNVGKPTAYAVMDTSKLFLDIPPDSSNAGIPIKFRYLRKLPVLTDFASTTLIPFYPAMSYYVQSCIERRKRNYDEADRILSVFTSMVNLAVPMYKLQISRAQQYYRLSNTVSDASIDAWWLE